MTLVGRIKRAIRRRLNAATGEVSLTKLKAELAAKHPEWLSIYLDSAFDEIISELRGGWRTPR